jgi:hypothetical protein
VIQATAGASKGCGYPLGETHALLVFAAGQGREAALGRMRGGVTVNGWGEVEVILSCEFAGAPCTILPRTTVERDTP